MQTREKQLLIGLGIALAVWQIGGRLVGSITEPLSSRWSQIEQLEKSVATAEEAALDAARKKKQLRQWRDMALSPDQKRGGRIDATNAQRLYLEWLTELAQKTGLGSLRVLPGQRAPKGDIYIAIGATIEGDATFEQLCQFLVEFEAAPLLQRLGRVRIDSQGAAFASRHKVYLDTEALVLLSLPPGSTLYASHAIPQELTSNATTVDVPAQAGFPTTAGFFIKANEESMEVTKIVGNRWTLRRGANETIASTHPSGTVLSRTTGLSLTQLQTAAKQLIDANLFAKPVPPVDYQPSITDPGQLVVVRGTKLTHKLEVQNANPALGQPTFRLRGESPSGMTLNKETGQIEWTPAESIAPQVYGLEVEAVQSPSQTVIASRSIDIDLKLPNSPPRLNVPDVSIAYIGQPWKLTLSAEDLETPADQLKFSLASDPTGGGVVLTGSTLTWKPAESTPTGPVKFEVVVTDQGSPAEKVSKTIEVIVADDAAQTTYLIAIVGTGNEIEAWCYDRLANRRWVYGPEAKFELADIKGQIQSIEKEWLVFTWNDRQYRWNLGDAARDAVLVPDE
jgi:Putative Ig domain